MRSKLEEGLKNLNDEMIAMGMLCESGIHAVENALETGKAKEAEKAIEHAQEVIQREREVESLCLKLMVLQSPMAGDIRTISSAMKMISDMRRIGEICGDMADIIRFMDGKCGLLTLQQMARETRSMVTGAIDAFVTQDENLAKNIIERDDLIDRLFVDTRKDIVCLIHENKDDGEYAVDLVMIAKYFEKIGDHCVNIGKWVRYSVTGVLEE